MVHKQETISQGKPTADIFKAELLQMLTTHPPLF